VNTTAESCEERVSGEPPSPRLLAPPELPPGGRTDAFWTRLALLPAGTIALVCFAGFAAWTVLISFTDSGLLPDYGFIGLHQYQRLFSSGRWWTTLRNLAIFGTVLLVGCTTLGYLLACLIDRRGGAPIAWGVVFILPLSVSFIVTGIVWQWMLNPSTGLQAVAHEIGWSGLRVDWLVRRDRSIFVVAIAGIWQQTGVSMILFLAGMSGIDHNIWRAATVDGIPAWRVYVTIIAPLLRHVFLLNTILLVATIAKSFDLVLALTGGGPGFASDLPARFVVEHMFERQELALGASGASVMMLTVLLGLSPYVYLRRARGESR